MKHYFKPGREHLRAVLGDKLPDVLTGRNGTMKALPLPDADPLAGLAAQLKTLTKADKARLARMLKA